MAPSCGPITVRNMGFQNVAEQQIPLFSLFWVILEFKLHSNVKDQVNADIPLGCAICNIHISKQFV